MPLDKRFAFECAPCIECATRMKGRKDVHFPNVRLLSPMYIYIYSRRHRGTEHTARTAYARNLETDPLSPRLSPQVAHMAWPARGIARDRREMQLLRSGLFRSSLPEHLHHLGRSIAAIARVHEVLCVGHDSTSRPFSWMQSWSNADESFGRVREGRV